MNLFSTSLSCTTTLRTLMIYDQEILSEAPSNVVFSEILSEYDAIFLHQMDQVKLMNRFDSKFCLPSAELSSIFEEVKNDYFVLDVDGVRSQEYNSIYYDTPDDRFYVSHHNGRATRMKLRKREYVDSGIAFLELKHKNNKGRTRKTRMPVDSLQPELNKAESEFVKTYIPTGWQELKAKFSTSFQRITLVSKNFDERCTIDTNLCFRSFNAGTSDCRDFAIIELKRDGRKAQTKLASVLKQRGIYKQNFSKYCVGRAMNETGLKRNQFKFILMKMKKQFAFG